MSKNSNQSHQAAVRALAFSPDGTYLASGGEDSKVFLWEATTTPKPPLKVRPAPRDNWEVSEVVFSSDGRQVLFINEAPSRDEENDELVTQVCAWDASSDQLVEPPDDAFSMHPIYFLAAGEDVGVIAAGAHFLGRLDPTTCKLRKKFRLEATHATVFSVVVGGPWVVSGHEDGTIRIWDPATGGVKRTLDAHEQSRDVGISALAVLPDSKALISASGRQIRTWNLANGRQVQSVPLQERVRQLAAAGSGHFLACDFCGRLWRSSTKPLSLKPLKGATDVTAVAASAAKGLVAVGHDDGTIQVQTTESLLSAT